MRPMVGWTREMTIDGILAQQEGAGASVMSAYVEIVFDNTDKRIDVSCGPSCPVCTDAADASAWLAQLSAGCTTTASIAILGPMRAAGSAQGGWCTWPLAL